MSAQTETTSHVARKNHRCTWCWQLVKPGESYKRYRFYDGGDTGTVKMHPECYGVITAIHANAVDMTLRGSTGKAVRVPKMVFDAAT